VSVLLTLLLAACSDRPHTLPRTPAGPPLTYVALGGGEVLGDGTGDPLREAWPQVLFRTKLPRSATFVNLASTGATVQDVLDRQVPLAVAIRPTLVTISVSDDLFRDTPVATFEATLHEVLQQLRGAGAPRVLLANVGLYERRPGYRACLTIASIIGTDCTLSPPVPQPDALGARTDALNASIARVAGSESVAVVDLHTAALADRAAGREAGHYTTAITPNAAGQLAIAGVFAHALDRP
jgi:lysophospholipase L1-like esterase